MPAIPTPTPGKRYRIIEHGGYNYTHPVAAPHGAWVALASLLPDIAGLDVTDCGLKDDVGIYVKSGVSVTGATLWYFRDRPRARNLTIRLADRIVELIEL